MKIDGYYSSGEFAKISGITKKTLRYYDEKNILKPALLTDSGARFYTNMDLGRLQQILLLKYLGFSLNDIKEMLVNDVGNHYLSSFLQVQRKLVEDRIEHLQLVAKSIQNTSIEIENNNDIDWSQMLSLIHMTSMEASLKNQYKNASNISARIQLHKLFSQNKKGWFPWIFEQLKIEENMKILEVGCGDGSLWIDSKIPKGSSVVLSDLSNGMLRDVKRRIGLDKKDFSYITCDCQQLPFLNGEFDLVIANNVLFYCEDVQKACNEIARVLKPNGRLISSTYGKDHMKEISKLASGFDERIVLSLENLYDCYGKENGDKILKQEFSKVEWKQYEDSLYITEAEPLISYVLSCHGNQNQYIVDNYSDFKKYVKQKILHGFHVTKDAGIFIAKK
jgi:ubiquinone/menaquinone biosynthesis C-methylase UbiE